MGEGEYLFSGGGENREGKGGKYLEKISPKSVKDIEMSWFWSRSRDFCQFLEGFGIGFGEFGLGKKVSVLVSENLVSEKKSQFQKIGYRKKSLGIGFGQNFGIDIQWCRGQTGCCLRHFLWTTLLPSNLNMSQF